MKDKDGCKVKWQNLLVELLLDNVSELHENRIIAIPSTNELSRRLSIYHDVLLRHFDNVLIKGKEQELGNRIRYEPDKIR